MINVTFILKRFLHDLVLFAGPHYKVHCTKDNLRVDVVKHEDVSAIYLQHLKDYPGERFFALKIWKIFAANFQFSDQAIIVFSLQFLLLLWLYQQNFVDPACKPEVVDSRATFNLKLNDIYQCMLTKVLNKNTVNLLKCRLQIFERKMIQGRTVYYHRVVMEYKDETPKQAFLVKCDMGLTPTNASSYDSEVSEISIVKRQADFPVNFQEE